METVKERLIHLHHCRGVTPKILWKILKADPSLATIYRLHPSNLQAAMGISDSLLPFFLKDFQNEKLSHAIKMYPYRNIETLTIFDREYPAQLREIFDPPPVLYAKGNLDLLSCDKVLSVVGARKPSEYGLHALNKVLPPLIDSGWLIISGLAAGIDAASHWLAVERMGKTIAVLGSGFDYIYPKENLHLAEVLAKNHLLLSEYPPSAKPQKWHFPMRNRIISGLAFGTLVVEAKRRSGSLITADQALSQGREVFAVPGPITSFTSEGTNHLIQQGAKLVMNHTDIIEEISSSRGAASW